MIEEQNAIIEKAEIFIEDHGILTAYVYLDYGGAGQGFGGYGLAGPYASVFIRKTLETVGVDKWSELEGKTVRARSEHVKVHAIGHIIEDKWFYPQKEFDAMKKEEQVTT